MHAVSWIRTRDPGIRRLHIYVLDRTANGIGLPMITSMKYVICFTIKWFVLLVKMFFHESRTMNLITAVQESKKRELLGITFCIRFSF